MPPPLPHIVDAVRGELQAATIPLDKLELLELVNAKIEAPVTHKEVNKALYHMNEEGTIHMATEMHGAKPTWFIGAKAEEAAFATAASKALAVAAETAEAAVASVLVAADDSDDEENKPLRERKNAPAVAQKPAAASKKRAVPAANGGDDDDDGDDDVRPDLGLALATAQAVLTAGKAGDHEAVLSALGMPVTYDSEYATQRKAYLALARMIHPDKLGGRFTGASTAFQHLVKAYEALTTPEVASAPAGSKGKGAKAKAAPKPLARSNENCYRTRVGCPRCGCQWGTADSGLQPYEYAFHSSRLPQLAPCTTRASPANPPAEAHSLERRVVRLACAHRYSFLMQGLRSYVCCGCLFSFGCMSATHECPLCHEDIEYHPDDFHKQVLLLLMASDGF